MAKKAQGISINVIIIAAIALLVLVILSVIFIGRVGIFGAKVAECENKGGKCGIACGDPNYGTQDYPTVMPDWNCPATADGEPQKCCIQVTT